MPAAHETMSEDEYLASEACDSQKRVLVDGQVVATAEASLVHDAIAANLIASLHARLHGKGCRPLGSDQRIHVPATGMYAYPDVTVVCGETKLHPRDGISITNPRVLGEVLSAETEALDRGPKFAHYRSLASLQEYVLVSVSERRVDHYRRADREWILHEYVGEAAEVALPSLGISLPLAELYLDVDL